MCTDLDWFKAWESRVMDESRLSAKTKLRHLLSPPCRQDLDSSITTALELVRNYTCSHREAAVITSLINTEIIENIVCQQRTVPILTKMNKEFIMTIEVIRQHIFQR